MALRSVLFDLDGVLLDTEGIYTDFWSEMDRIFPTGIADFAHVIKGNTLTHIFDTYFPNIEVQEKIRELLRKQELEMAYRPFDGALELLAELKARGITTAIVTSSNAVKMRHIFKSIPELEQLTDTLVVDEDVTASKPDPEGYLLAAERLGAKQGEFAVVEDSLAGLKAGQNAGALVIGIATTNPLDTIKPLSHISINSIDQLSVDDICQGLNAIKCNN